MSRLLTISLPIADRQRSYAFYQDTLGLEPFGEPAEDGVPEPLQFRLDQRTSLMLVPTGGFGWVLGSRDVAPPGVSEVLLSLNVASAEAVSAVVTRMHDAGGEVLAEPAQQDWGFTAVATDPDGHAWQIIAEVG
ncbi:VOC family protein [Nesterenkonia ebinurensis]|uniref:VOC family protein n=1 Tax=Nesterenkonia ebinurensis TaxID=2608252 RepID=UPI00123D84C1|nr:VOC family protein [Nesterenkonia ebinurensis]